ncbi:MAG: primosomal protein N' (replication factor Y) - superfamily II helicase [Rhodobacterales bacterium]|nr:primosomal protein N' (replication factor Y) - superfamily II helicase [Rhodobacterales bacterium]NCT12078.1 primosomal protein N' (replication factor Y) - superfamily II helicase [Rhodobacterales bacterium]
MSDITEAPETEKFHFPCAQCGSDLRYTPGATELTCPHCGHVQPIVATGSRDDAMRELDFQRTVATQLSSADYEETRVLTCPSCGAQTEFAETTQAARCPFCDTVVVTDTGTHRHIKPQGLLPFVLDERTARAAMTTWLGRLWFAPNGLKDYARKGRAMNGIYVPFWTFDADTKSTYRGERGDDYYETRTVTRNGKSETERVRKTRWSNRSGAVARFFDDVLVLASKSLPRRYTDALAPWDLKALSPYQPEFLAGFRAEGYQVLLEDGFVIAREYMDQVIRDDVRRDIGGDHQRIHNVDTFVNDVTFKHILLPIWLAAYKFNGKTYQFVVNGQTGKVQGERPWSKWKIAIAVIIALIIAGGIGYGIYLNDQGGV